jgi:predicted transcriptional regulator
MTTPVAHDARIDLRIPRAWRRKLDRLADQVGLSPSDLGRLAIRQFLQCRNLSVKLEDDR